MDSFLAAGEKRDGQRSRSAGRDTLAVLTCVGKKPPGGMDQGGKTIGTGAPARRDLRSPVWSWARTLINLPMPDENDTEDTEDEAQENGVFILYERLSNQFRPPDEHRCLNEDEDVWLAPTDDPYVDRVEGVGMIDVLQWEFSPDERISLSGPPEVVADEDGFLWVYRPRPNGQGTQEFELGKFQCQRCDNVQGRHLKIHDNVTEPKMCESCERKGPFKALGLDGTGLDVRMLSEPIWKLPRGISDDRYSEIWNLVHWYVSKYWFTTNEWLYDGLTAYAISTWLRPNFDFLPHLMVVGTHETGKTRLLNTLSEVSYRAIVPVSASASSVFRTVDEYDTTFYLSEYHDLSDETRNEIESLIKGAQKRNEIVLRTEQNGDKYRTRSFDIFTHVGVGTQFNLPDDTASRCIEVRTEPAKEQMPDLASAPEIRDELLYARWRLHESDEWKDAWSRAEEFLSGQGIKHRLREKLLPLVAVAVVWDELDSIRQFVQHIAEKSEEVKAHSEDAMVVQSMMEIAFGKISGGRQSTLVDDPWENVSIKYSAICRKYEELDGEEMTPSRLGHVLKRMPVSRTRYNDGTYVEHEDLGSTLKELAEQHGLAWESLSGNDVDDPSMTKSQRESMRDILAFVREEEGDDPVPTETVFEEFDDEDRGEIENRMETLLRKGEIYEADDDGRLRAAK